MTTKQQDNNGAWKQAVPLPLYGIKKMCGCGKKFWREKNYEKHYRKNYFN